MVGTGCLLVKEERSQNFAVCGEVEMVVFLLS